MAQLQRVDPMINPFKKPGARPVYGKVLLFGESGVGKTHFTLNSPNPAVVDPERGTDWFRGRPGFGDWAVMDGLGSDIVDQVHYALSFLEQGFEIEEAFDQVLGRKIERLTHRRKQLIDEATGIQYPVHDRETIVFDPITLLWEQIQFDQSLKVEKSDRQNKEDFSWKDQGEMKRDYKTFLTRMINLPMHVMCVARQGVKRDQATSKVLGNAPDAEKSTIYNFDLAFELVNTGSRREAIIYKDRSGTHAQFAKVENPSWDSLVVPILQKLQARGPLDEALGEMARAWRAAGVTDMAAKVIVEQQTGKTRSQDLTLPEIQQLTAWFLEVKAKREGGGA